MAGQSGGDPPLHPQRIAHPNQAFFAVGDKDLKKLQKAAWRAGWWPDKKKKEERHPVEIP